MKGIDRMEKAKGKAFFYEGSWYHRTKILKDDFSIAYSKKGGFATEKEAIESYEKMLREFEDKRLALSVKRSNNITLRDYLNYWFYQVKVPEILSSTRNVWEIVLTDTLMPHITDIKLSSCTTDYDSYSYNLKNHIYPKLGNMKLTDINKGQLISFFAAVYICCSSYGRPRSATYASNQYKALLRDNGLPDIRFHDLRHTYASMLLSEELSVKAVSNTLGHAKSIVTVDVYGDKARIIGDGTDAMRPTLEYVLPTEYITSREVGVLKKRVVYDRSIGFPEELAGDIMECLLHKCA